MKISKVNHTRSGVGVEQAQAQGMLYATPKKSAENHVDLDAHVKNLNKNAQKLYSIFSKASIAQQGKAKYRFSEIEKLSKELKDGVLEEKKISAQLQALERWIGEKRTKNYNLEAADIDRAVDLCLRNSLRKSVSLTDGGAKCYLPDLVKKLLKEVTKTGPKNEEVSQEEKQGFLRALNEDYTKNEALGKIVRSIELQNVRVEGAGRDGIIRLQLSNANHKNKHYVFSFLQKFAAQESEGGRENLLRHFKQLVLLFYCGRQKYEESLDMDMPVWNWGFFGEDQAANFDEDAYCMINDRASASDKAEKKKLDTAIRQSLRTKIKEQYREAVKADGVTQEDRYWIGYIQDSAEKLLLSKRDISPVRLSVAYLCEHTFREWVSYICMKYIDLGKGVYHFTVPKDIGKVVRGEAPIGEVLPEYQNGITSFDYERMKAEETLCRELSVYITFAVNTFAMSVLDSEFREKSGHEDILSVKAETLEKEARKDVERRLLQFFGGKSTWEQDGALDGVDGITMVKAFQEALRAVRNCNFHYTGMMPDKIEDAAQVLQVFFQKEYERTGKIYRDKYYSNNVWMFYSQKDICALMDALYCKEPETPAQVPAFQKIIKKANMEDVVTAFIMGKKKKKLLSGDNSVERMEQFRACLMFVLKEVYYYGFLQDGKVKEYFLEEVEKDREYYAGKAENTNRKPIASEKPVFQNFAQYLDELLKSRRELTFGEICQQIMTDYNQQNQGMKSVSSNQKGHDREKYKHFRMLLYLYMKEAFLQYLKNGPKKEQYRFLREPEKREIKEEQDSFCAQWRPHLYDALKEKVSGNNLQLAWYAMAHFLSQRQLNQMIGCIKNYIQYIQDIERRCQDTGNAAREDIGPKVTQYKEIISVLEFTKQFCGSVTNCFEDYFQDAEDYASHLADYVDFKNPDYTNNVSLREFCMRKVPIGSPTGTVGIYYDELNPVINKNIVYARMYGNEKLFRQCIQKISEKDIRNYYKSQNKLADVFKNGQCKDMEEEKELRSFQNQKNHIELTEISIYSEIVNEFMGQLVSWAYLRERDLMYYQLGFHYMRLFYTDSVEKDSYLRRLEGEQVHILDGAVLYQIIAMYTYHLPLITREQGTGKAVPGKEDATSGESIGMFCRYCQDKGELYEMGLSLFEDTKEHDEIVSFRNYIDHFKYYAHLDRSIMELYSDVYDRFFTYDVKLKKSVSFIFRNILLRHFVIANTAMQSGESIKYYARKKQPQMKPNAAKLVLKSLESDEFQLSKGNLQKAPANTRRTAGKQKGRKEQGVEARGLLFLEQLKKILEYKE